MSQVVAELKLEFLMVTSALIGSTFFKEFRHTKENLTFTPIDLILEIINVIGDKLQIHLIFCLIPATYAHLTLIKFFLWPSGLAKLWDKLFRHRILFT